MNDDDKKQLREYQGEVGRGKKDKERWEINV